MKCDNCNLNAPIKVEDNMNPVHCIICAKVLFIYIPFLQIWSNYKQMKCVQFWYVLLNQIFQYLIRIIWILIWNY